MSAWNSPGALLNAGVQRTAATAVMAIDMDDGIIREELRNITADFAVSEGTRVTVAAFYKFVTIGNPAELQSDLRGFCARRGLKGTILIASEGINATICGLASDVEALVGRLRSEPRFADIAFKISHADDPPFQRLKVKIKAEIVTFGVPETQSSTVTGILVEPKDWNALISEPGVVVIDTRNDYEVEVGTFEGAHNPHTSSFREFPDFVARELAGDKQRKIAMFCTGGIRCEKASSYMLSQGFTDVHQLSGGILKYLEVVPPSESLWRGECFVFDERVALEHGVRQGHHELCACCGHPVRVGEGQQGAVFCASCREHQAAPLDISPAAPKS